LSPATGDIDPSLDPTIIVNMPEDFVAILEESLGSNKEVGGLLSLPFLWAFFCMLLAFDTGSAVSCF
jgi:hypothetical protein